ncbi:MAG: CDP-glucose 4,6-dehydratase [Bdellovibrio sp.]|nr:CDP-glucose 4,6-dehydratase [Bdellovibrio sp.]
MNLEFWRGRKVFITGHTGFRGSWLALTLQKAGAEVFGFSLSPNSSPNFFEVANVGQGVNSTFADIRDRESLSSALNYSAAEVVFHLAGGGGLKDSWDKVTDVYSSQVMGTINLLECLRETATVRAAVILSSDKIYRAENEAHKELAPLAGSSPAATAKACSDLILESYLSGVFAPEKYNKHKIALASARMGAVIGGGDFSFESLIWQLAQAEQAGLELPLKNPNSIRPWMHVDDAVSALLTLGQALLESGPKASGSWNFGVDKNNQGSVGQVAALFTHFFKGSECPLMHTPENPSIHGLLDSSKARTQLGWSADTDIPAAIRKTTEWYKNYFGT